MSEPRIVVVGSTNVDLIVRVPHLPAPGETVTDGRFVQAFGGKGANSAVGARRAGGAVTFVTATGTDDFGRQVRTALAGDGIDLRFATEVDAATGTALILVDQEGRNSIAVAPGANDLLLPGNVAAAESAFREADAIVLQMEVPLPTVRATLDLAERHGKPVVFNYAPVRSRELAVDGKMTTLIVNEIEAADLTERPVRTPDDAEEAALNLLGYGPQLVVVTLGAAGSVVVSAELRAHIAAFPVTAVDTTAAGDIFCGAMAVALAEGRAPESAVRFASAASAISVTRMGAQPSAPTRSEIKALLSA